MTFVQIESDYEFLTFEGCTAIAIFNCFKRCFEEETFERPQHGVQYWVCMIKRNSVESFDLPHSGYFELPKIESLNRKIEKNLRRLSNDGMGIGKSQRVNSGALSNGLSGYQNF